MSRWALSLAMIVVASGVAFGQPQGFPMAPPPNVLERSEILEAPPASVFDNLHHGGPLFVSGEAEYLLWFLKGSRSTFPVFSTSGLGALGATADELGDTDRGRGPISGGRFTLGYWQFDNNPWVSQGAIRTLGGEARFFFVGSRAAELSIDSPPNLFRPFFDFNNRTQSAFLVASPGVATGAVNARAQLSIWGAEANVWKNVYYDKPGTTCAIDLMVGCRYLNANSEFDITSTSVFNSTIAAGSPFASFAGNRLQVADSFAMHNHFIGGQIGIAGRSWFIEHASIQGSLRVALGATRQDATITGSQVRTFPGGATATSTGGLLALPSNSGTRHNFKFTQIPEAELKVLWPIGNQLTLSAGFTAIYWNRVARAADQIDRSIDITQIPNFPGAAGTTPSGFSRPGVSFQQTDLWMLGISLGLEYRW